jgi:hypothetical protein
MSRAVQQQPNGRRALQQLCHGMRLNSFHTPGPCLTFHIDLTLRLRPDASPAAGRGHTPPAVRLRPSAFGDARLRQADFHGRYIAPNAVNTKDWVGRSEFLLPPASMRENRGRASCRGPGYRTSAHAQAAC